MNWTPKEVSLFSGSILILMGIVIAAFVDGKVAFALFLLLVIWAVAHEGDK
jgi:hypothetical protein